MKKTVVISVLAMIVLLLSTTVVNAATAADLPSTLYSIGAKYGATAADRAKVERYIADNKVTDAEADAVIAKAREAANLMDEAGVTDYRKLPADKKAQLKSIANSAASVLGLTLTFGNGNVAVYKDGKLIDSMPLPSGNPTSSSSSTKPSTSATSAGLTQGSKLVYTGSNYNFVLIGTSVAGLALVSVLIGKKVVNA